MYTFGGMLTSKENELFAEFFKWVGDIDSAIVPYGPNNQYYELSGDRNFTHSYPAGSTIKLFKTDQTSVLPATPPPPTPEDGGLSPGAIAGIVCGGVAGLALLTFAFVRLARTQCTKSPYETLTLEGRQPL